MLQGFAVWTEEKPGKASNWYFILPNANGTRVDGTRFSGLAVRLYHGVVISWDGRVLRRCTSVSKPDGEYGAKESSGGGQRFDNYLHGTFTACKEKVVQAGRANACAALSSACGDDTTVGVTASRDGKVTLGKGLVGVHISALSRHQQRQCHRVKERRRGERST